MKKTFALSLLLLLFFLTCKKNDSDPTSSTPPSTEGTPEPTPVGTPVGPATTMTMGPAGGTITSSDGTVTLTIPPGALVADTMISVQAITNNAPGGLTAYRLGPNGMHFSSPVTLRFNYPDSVQIPELLGIAYQDTDNIWYWAPDYSVDSTTHTVSTSIAHFSDWVDFERVRIVPQQATLWVNQTLGLELLEYVPEEATQPQPIYRVTNEQVTWSASAGTISRSSQPSLGDLAALYRAPSSIPAGNPVRVSATLSRRFTYHGTIIPTNRTTFFSYVTITDSIASFHVDLYYHNTQYMAATLPFTLDDTCSMDVEVHQGRVDVYNFANHNSSVTPTQQSLGQCTLTWVPGGVGPMNVVRAQGSLDTLNHVNVVLFHTAFDEEFTYACPGEPPITMGNNPTSGNPGSMSFDGNWSGRFYVQINDVVDAWVTRR